MRENHFGTILDVGANTGQFARAAHAVFPDIHIYSFEPLPFCVDRITARMRDVPHFRAFQSAIGNEDGRIVIHQSTASPSSSILTMTDAHTTAFPWTQGGHDIEVDLHRLDFFLPEMTLTGHVLLKIDVQGYSLPVLEGAPETLLKVDTVLVETSFIELYEGEANFDQVYRFMVDAGFRFMGLLDQLAHPESGAPLQGDAIFRRSQAVAKDSG